MTDSQQKIIPISGVRALRAASDHARAMQIVFEAVCKAHAQAFEQIIHELAAQKSHVGLNVIAQAFLSEMRADLEWYESRTAYTR